MEKLKVINKLGYKLLLLAISMLLFSFLLPNSNEKSTPNRVIKFSYSNITGIGYEKGVSRRDPSDIIKVNGKYFIWYTKISKYRKGKKTPLYPSGYSGTIWYAVSKDKGHTWKEKGEVLGPGNKGAFDSYAVFTPNILKEHGKYYLYYTGVKPTPGDSNGKFENNSKNDFTAIGVAVAAAPDGPFERISNDPVLTVSNIDTAFDSYRIDDAALVARDDKIWLYYKGRSKKYGRNGPEKTQMGVALAERPEGPFKKYSFPVLSRSHEVLVWNQKGGIAALASLSHSLNWAPDGLHFSTIDKNLLNIPIAPGMYRPHLTHHHQLYVPGWGISMNNREGNIYLVRFKMKVYKYGKKNIK